MEELVGRKMILLLFDSLSKRYMILVEEKLGLDQCVVTSHNLEHATKT